VDEFKKGWGALLAATVGMTFGIMTATNYSQGFFVGAVTTEFGWSRPQFFLSYTVLMCMGLISGPIIGSLVGKYGVRTLGIIGLIGHAIGYVILSFNNGSLLVWYSSFAILAILGAGSLAIVWTTILNDYFVKHRGKAIGITMTGTGIGALILPPVTTFLIDAYGWRAAYQAIGIGSLIVSLPIVFAVIKPKLVSSEGDIKSVADTGWGLSRRDAMKTKQFWLLGAVLFLTVIVIVGLLSNFKPILISKGLDGNTIAWIASVLGLTIMVGRLLVGALIDKFWAPAVASVIFFMPIISILLLVMLPGSVLVAVLVALTLGLAAGAELDLLAYLTSKYFGPRYYSSVFGCIFAFFAVGAGIGPPIFGGVGQLHGYDTILVISIGVLVLSIILFLLMGRYPKQEEL
jgi:predicted MFS family arabinose efflux permease